MLAVYTLSVILKSLLMKFCPRSRQGPRERVDEKKEGGDESNPLRGRVEWIPTWTVGTFTAMKTKQKRTFVVMRFRPSKKNRDKQRVKFWMQNFEKRSVHL